MIWLFLTVAVPIVACTVLWLVHVMPSLNTPWHIKVSVSLAWFTALSCVIMMPLDVSRAYGNNEAAAGALPACWLTVYWVSFAFQVLILPFHSEYATSCEFTVLDALLYALANNLLFYGVLAAVGGVGVGLLLATHKTSWAAILGYCIAFSNAYGLIGALFLCGFGLVDIPRVLWSEADVVGAEEHLYTIAGRHAAAVTKHHRELTRVVEEVTRVNGMFSRRDPLRKYMDVLIDTLRTAGGPTSTTTLTTTTTTGVTTTNTTHAARRLPAGMVDDTDDDYFTRRDLARLRRRLTSSGEAFDRSVAMYKATVVKYLHVHEVSINAQNPQRVYISSLYNTSTPQQDNATTLSSTTTMMARVRWWWSCRVRKPTFRLLSVICWLLLLAILAAEATIQPPLPTIPNLSPLAAMLRSVAQHAVLTQLWSFVTLGYLCLTGFYALYRAARFQWYLLVPGHSPSYSLCSNAMFMTRFAPPLAFHFLYALAMPPLAKGYPDYENTVFFQQIGNHIQNAPLFGVSFTTWAPLVLFPYVALLLTGAFNTLATTLAPRGAPVAFDLDYAMGTEHDTGVRLLHLEAEAYQRGQPVGAATLPLLRDGGPGVVEGVAVAVEGWGGVEGGGGWVGWLWGGKRGRRAQGQGLNRPLLIQQGVHTPTDDNDPTSSQPRGWASPVGSLTGSLTRGITSLLGGGGERGQGTGNGSRRDRPPQGLAQGVGTLHVESDHDEEGPPRRWGGGGRWGRG